MTGRDRFGTEQPSGRDLLVVGRKKGRELYVWTFWADRSLEAVDSMAEAAGNPELSFTWNDYRIVLEELTEKLCWC